MDKKDITKNLKKIQKILNELNNYFLKDGNTASYEQDLIIASIEYDLKMLKQNT